MLEDKLLIRRFNRGDKEALRSIYEKYRTDLLKIAAALLYDRNAMEDVIQDVFVSLARMSGRFQLYGSLKGYLAISVANRSRDRNRKQQRHPTVNDEEMQTLAARDVEPVQEVAQNEIKQRLAQAIQKLPEEQREVIVLRLQSRIQFRQIARARNVSIHTIQSRYRYGLEKLRTAFNGEVQK